MKVKEYYLAGRGVILNSGNIARVWVDPINNNSPLRSRFPMLYSFCNHQEITVAGFQNYVGDDLFRRRLHPPLVEQWVSLRLWWTLGPYHVSQIRLFGLWKGKKHFLTKSVYAYLERHLAGCDYRWIWKARLPLKIQIFLWQLFQDTVLTRDVMKRRNWAGNPRCSFCREKETSQHLFFTCPVARVVWRTIGCVLGTEFCPNNLWQFFSRCYVFLPDGAKFYTFGLAAMCWSIWDCRN